MANENRIAQGSPELGEVPLGFPDSASSLCDMMNTTMEAVLNEIMSIQAGEACGAAYGTRSDSRTNSRNGYRERRLGTTVGTLDLGVPKLRRGSCFPTDILERHSRADRALAAAVAGMYVTGTSTRKVERVAAKFGVDSLSKDQVSRLCAVIDGEVDAFASRGWSGMRFAYLFLGAAYVRCRSEGRSRSQALVTAVGVGDDGRRHCVGLACADAEAYASWRGFLQDLRDRGAGNVRLVVSDAHDGLRGAISEAYPEAAWQRCIAHVRRDVPSAIEGKRDRDRAAAAMAPVFGESEPAVVRAAYHAAVDETGAFAPGAAAILADAEVDALAYLSSPPREHRAKIRTNDVEERMNREIKRRTRVVQVFPSPEAATRLAGGALREIDAEWESERRCVSPASLAQVLDLERAENGVLSIVPDEDAVAAGRLLVRLALDAFDKVA